MNNSQIHIRRTHLVGVLLANGVLWVAAVLVRHNHMLAGPAAVGLISIASLFFSRLRAT